MDTKCKQCVIKPTWLNRYLCVGCTDKPNFPKCKKQKRSK